MNRLINPENIRVPQGYKIEVFAKDLTTPINLIINENDEMFLADSGVTDGNGKVLKMINNSFTVIADGFNPPLTGINYHNGTIYVSHRGKITAIKPNGEKVDIIAGLPSWGDHHNNQVMFGPDCKMYFGQGTATNSGVVGLDNISWVENHPQFHDYPGEDIMLRGQNYLTENPLTNSQIDKSCTGAYSPFGVPTSPCEKVKGVVKANGSILRANPDGSDLELVCWGLRNPFRLKFDRFGRLFCTNHGLDVRGSRPVDNSPDEFQLIQHGAWYGWPDYTGGLPVTLAVFKPDTGPQPTFLLASHPMVPPKPFVCFPNHSANMGFDFNYNPKFGPIGDAYVSLFGSEAPETTGGKPLPCVGHRVVKVDMNTREVTDFAINKSGCSASFTGSGGLERPIDVVFDKRGNMYVVDFALFGTGKEESWLPNTGVIWKISRA